MSDFRLQVFHCVSKNLSFTKAAQELFISQPAISKHIQELETEYGVRLFERQGNKIALTKAGDLLLQNSEKILEEYKKLEYEMHILQNKYAGELRLGASTTIAQYVLPPLLAVFIEKFPQIKLSLLNGNSREIEQALNEHRIDIGMVEGNLRQNTLRYSTFIKDELVAVTHANNQLSKRDEISLKELISIPLVLRERGSGTLDVLESALMKHDIRLSHLNIKMHLGSTESIKLFLEHSECIGIVSIRSINREIYAGKFKIIDIPELKMERDFSIVQHLGEESGIAKLFIQFSEHYTKL